MATQNKALKKRAQTFALAHNMSYLKALKAVDEPFHGLRDFLAEAKVLGGANMRQQFRLHGVKGIFSDAFDERHRLPSNVALSEYRAEAPVTVATLPPLQTSIAMREEALEHRIRPQLGYPTIDKDDFLILMGERLRLLKDHGAKTIWELRELQRAGIIEPMVDLSLKRHYYGLKLEDALLSAMESGANLGFFTVAMGAYSDLQNHRNIHFLTPVLPKVLDALFSGASGLKPDFDRERRGILLEDSRFEKGALQGVYKAIRYPWQEDNFLTVLAVDGVNIRERLLEQGLDFDGFEKVNWLDAAGEVKILGKDRKHDLALLSPADEKSRVDQTTADGFYHRGHIPLDRGIILR